MNGILCLDKPADMTSFSACARVRRMLGIKKTGHTGTLDPMATGVLPILCGNATRALDFLPSHDKRYLVTVRLGLTSDTADIWGAVEETGRPLPTRDEVDAALAPFRGNILQVPPMMSAIKKDGVRLYELHRRGIEIEREARPVTVHSLELVDFDGDTFTLDCLCSKGTYMRTIAEDLGRALGCGAVMSGLRRTMAVGYSLDDCVTLEQLAALCESGQVSEHICPVDKLLDCYESLTVTSAQGHRFRNGGALSLDRLSRPVSDLVRVYDADGSFIGLGIPRDEELAVARLFLT